jgi:hypothetical protein
MNELDKGERIFETGKHSAEEGQAWIGRQQPEITRTTGLVQTTVREAPSLINKAPLCLKGVKTLARCDSYAKGVGRLGLSSSELAAATDD